MALPSIKNRVGMTVTGTPGTGTITLNAADTGYQSFATAYAANANVDILIEEGSAWEIARDCAYTNTGTTVTRGTLEASSTGAALSLTSAAKVYVVDSATRIGRHNVMLQSVVPGGRLTLTTGVPVTTSDVTAATTIYYTPYVHNIISLWDGAGWTPTEFAETSHALGTVTAALPYDVFGYLASGVLALEKLAWTNDTTRATAVTLQDGRYCKSGDKTRLLLGTFYTTATTTTEDSAVKRYVGNLYNLATKSLYKGSGDVSHTYNLSTYRNWNNDATMGVFYVAPLPFIGAINVVGGSNVGDTAGWIKCGPTELSGFTSSSLAAPTSQAQGLGRNAVMLEQRSFGTTTYNWGFLAGACQC